MSDDRFHDPPLEAYSRVTNPGRFQPLHSLALDLLERLGAEYDVRRSHELELLPDMRPFEQARPPIELAPVGVMQAPIAIGFTTYPSLVVRCGRWLSDSFPSCGCDACAETAEGEWERLRRLLDHVVAGRFREEVKIPLLGEARLMHELGSDASGQRGSGARVLSRARARALVGGGPRVMHWRPWSVRAGAASG